MGRVIVGVDPHKKSVTIEVIDEQGTVLATGRFATTSSGYQLMTKFVRGGSSTPATPARPMPPTHTRSRRWRCGHPD